jgi:hypothetical protein
MVAKNVLASLSLLVGLAGTLSWSPYALAIDEEKSSESENVEALDASVLEELSDENIDALLADPVETVPVSDSTEQTPTPIQKIDDIQDEQMGEHSSLEVESTDSTPTDSMNVEVQSTTDTSLSIPDNTPKEKVSQPSKIPLAATIPSQSIGPSRGSTMNDVRAEVGEPSEILSPVGDPPISRWVYGDYTIVFEHDRVVHVVAKRS